MNQGPDGAGTFWSGRSVLVTGATGLVGSSLVPRLVASGANVVALVRDTAPRSLLVKEGWLKHVQSVHGSFTDADIVRRTMAEYSVSTVFHLGAQTLVGVAQKDPLGTLESNIRGTWNVLEGARQTGVRQVLLASTVLVAGSDAPREAASAVGQLRQPYEISKICGERIGVMFARTYHLRVGVVRCGNLYGAGDLNFSRLIPGAIRSALEGQRFRFRGTGKLMRDFLHVEDAVDGYVRLAQQLEVEPGLSGEPFTFGLGIRHSMLEVVGRIAKATGRDDLQPVTGIAPSAEISEQDIDSTAARNKLGWAPVFGLEEGIRRTVNWYQKHFERGPEADPGVRALGAAI